MPKMKTNKGAAKRFKKTAGGIKFKHATKRHILTKRTTKTSVNYVQTQSFLSVKWLQLFV